MNSPGFQSGAFIVRKKVDNPLDVLGAIQKLRRKKRASPFTMRGKIENEAYLSDSCKKLQLPGIFIYHQRIITKCDRTFSFLKLSK